MRLVKYELNADGTIPSEILDGGHFPTDSGKASPQDLTLLGWTESESFGEEVTDLKSYLVSIGADLWTDYFGEPTDLDLLVSDFLAQ
jgi:hypothetical protein